MCIYWFYEILNFSSSTGIQQLLKTRVSNIAKTKDESLTVPFLFYYYERIGGLVCESLVVENVAIN